MKPKNITILSASTQKESQCNFYPTLNMENQWNKCDNFTYT